MGSSVASLDLLAAAVAGRLRSVEGLVRPAKIARSLPSRRRVP